MPNDCNCDYCRAERGQSPLRKLSPLERNMHKPVSAARQAQSDEYVRQCLVAKEATHLAYREDNLHRAAAEAVDKDMTLAEFEVKAGAAYERARAYRALKGLSTPALRYLERMRETGGDTESAEATDAWYNLSEKEQDIIDRYLDMEKAVNHGRAWF